MNSSEPLWCPTSRVPPIAEGEVHVWLANLGAGWSTYTQEALLSIDERAHAARFRFERDRAQYTSARVTLRMLLAGYLAVRPDQIELQYSVYGKPSLDGTHSSHPLRFNVSHSHSVGLVAAALHGEVGVDIEMVRGDLAIADLARRFFSPLEAAAIVNAPPGVRHRLFFVCWTRKEAFLKARGDGLSLTLDSLDVVSGDNHRAQLRAHWDPDEATRWQLSDLDPGEGYAGALVVMGKGWSVQYRELVV